MIKNKHYVQYYNPQINNHQSSNKQYQTGTTVLTYGLHMSYICITKGLTIQPFASVYYSFIKN